MEKSTKKLVFMDSTIRIVAQAGLENLRTKQIAQASGASEATMYMHFASKEEILRETFFLLDEKLSSRLTKNAQVLAVINGSDNLETVGYKIWKNVYRYLIEHREETLFAIRYRYSSYYTDEVFSKRRAYSGDFDSVYQAISKHFSNPDLDYCSFVIDYAFEMTFSFVEKIISGRIEDTLELQQRIWLGIRESIKQLME